MGVEGVPQVSPWRRLKIILEKVQSIPESVFSGSQRRLVRFWNGSSCDTLALESTAVSSPWALLACP